MAEASYFRFTKLAQKWHHHVQFVVEYFAPQPQSNQVALGFTSSQLSSETDLLGTVLHRAHFRLLEL